MPRSPKPWYWKARKGWYVTIDGTRHHLADKKKAADKRFHQLMAQPRQRIIQTDCLAAIFDKFLTWTEKHRAADTYEWYRSRLELFVKKYPDLRVSEFKPFHVQEWIDEIDGVKSGTLRNYCRAVKRACKWAKQQGYLSENPIADFPLPKGGKRDTVIGEEEFRRILELVPSSEFRELLEVTWETGCRPQESLALEARHVQLTNSRWVFEESEAKGDMGRVVYLTDRAAAITKKQMLRYPTGKLFRNSSGKPWTTEAVNCAFIRLQHRLGLSIANQQGLEPSEQEIQDFSKSLRPTRREKGKKVTKTKRELYVEARRKLRLRNAEELAPKYCLYVLRHSWATHALQRGVDSLTVAVLMGHKDPSTLAKVYQHLAHNPDYLLGQVRRAVG